MLDVHDEIDPTTREWVTVDETGHAFMDVDEARAEALGGAFETWLNSKRLFENACVMGVGWRGEL